MTDTTLKAVEAASGTDLGAIQVLQGATPVKIAKSTIVDANGNPISYAVLDVKGAGAAADALRVHLSNEALAALEQITATVTGPIALDAATLAALETINIGNFPAAQGVNLTQVNGAAHSAGNPLFADITDRIARILGTAKAQQDGSWTVALDAPTLAALETISVANFPTNQGVSLASGPGTAESSPLFAFERPANVKVKQVSAANTAQTVTLAAVAGQFHYIVGIHISRYNSTATAVAAAAANLAVTTTNLGGLEWRRGNAVAAGAGDDLVAWFPSNPIKSDAANVATTFVIPALGAGIVAVANIVYFTAP